MLAADLLAGVPLSHRVGFDDETVCELQIASNSDLNLSWD